MKKQFFAVMLLLLIGFAAVNASAYAGPKSFCEVTGGDFDNSMLTIHGPVTIESHGEEGFDPFSLATIQKLTINTLGKDETFSVNGISISGSTKIDLSLDAHPDQVRAVLLSAKTPGQIGNKFEALLVITGTNIHFEGEGVPVFSAASLVYNLKCKEIL